MDRIMATLAIAALLAPAAALGQSRESPWTSPPPAAPRLTYAPDHAGGAIRQRQGGVTIIRPIPSPAPPQLAELPPAPAMPPAPPPAVVQYVFPPAATAFVAPRRRGGRELLRTIVPPPGESPGIGGPGFVFDRDGVAGAAGFGVPGFRGGLDR